MAESSSSGVPAESVPANQVSVPRWAELKRAYVARLSASERAALAAAAEHAHDHQD